MKAKIIQLLFAITAILLLVILYYYPFETNRKCGEFSLCWVKFGVYEYDYDSEAGNPYFGKDLDLFYSLF